MGAASYNRGSKAISDRLDRDQPAPEMRILRDLSDYSARHAGAILFAPTVVRFLPNGNVVLMNRADRGWGEYGREYGSLWTLARHWRLVFLEFTHDEHSRLVRVAPLPKPIRDGMN